MLDPKTGLMKQLTPAQAREFFEANRSDGDGVIARPIFREGEILSIRGGWFRVHRITAKKLTFKGVPEAVAVRELTDGRHVQPSTPTPQASHLKPLPALPAGQAGGKPGQTTKAASE